MSMSMLDQRMDPKTRKSTEAIMQASAEICKATKKMRNNMIKRIQKANALDNYSNYSATSLNSQEEAQQLTFNKGQLDLNVLQTLMGTLEIVEDGSRPFALNTISKFKWINRIPIELIAATSTGNVWVCDCTAKLSLVGESGSILFSKKLKFLPESLSVDDTDTVYFSCFSKKRVMRLSPFGDVVNILNTSPLHPIGVSVMDDGGFILSLVSNMTTNPKSNKDRQIVKAVLGDKNSLVTERFFIHDDPLTFPYRVLENITGDVLVIDALTNVSGRILAFTEQGSLKFIYTGIENGPDDLSEQKFSPTAICRDMAGNIITTDGNTGILHVLSSTGSLKRLIQANEIGSGDPTSLSFGNDGSLWIGHASGEITVHRYITAEEQDEIDTNLDPITGINQRFDGFNYQNASTDNFRLSTKMYESISYELPDVYKTDEQLDHNDYNVSDMNPDDPDRYDQRTDIDMELQSLHDLDEAISAGSVSSYALQEGSQHDVEPINGGLYDEIDHHDRHEEEEEEEKRDEIHEEHRSEERSESFLTSETQEPEIIISPIDREDMGFIKNSVQETVKTMEESLKRRATERESGRKSETDGESVEDLARQNTRKKYFQQTVLSEIMHAASKRSQ